MKIYKHNHSEVFNLFMASQLKKRAVSTAAVGDFFQGLARTFGFTSDSAEAIAKGGKNGIEATKAVARATGKSQEAVKRVVKVFSVLNKSEFVGVINDVDKEIEEVRNISHIIYNFALPLDVIETAERIPNPKSIISEIEKLGFISPAYRGIADNSQLSDAEKTLYIYQTLQQNFTGIIKSYESQLPAVNSISGALEYAAKDSPEINQKLNEFKNLKKEIEAQQAALTSFNDLFNNKRKILEDIVKSEAEQKAAAKVISDQSAASNVAESVADEAAEAVGGAEKIAPEAAKAVKTEAEAAQEAAEVAQEAAKAESKAKAVSEVATAEGEVSAEVAAAESRVVEPSVPAANEFSEKMQVEEGTILKLRSRNPDGTVEVYDPKTYTHYKLSAEQARDYLARPESSPFFGEAFKVKKPMPDVSYKPYGVTRKVGRKYINVFKASPKTTLAVTALTLGGIAGLGLLLYGSWLESKNLEDTKSLKEEYAKDNSPEQLKSIKMKPGSPGEKKLTEAIKKKEELNKKIASIPLPDKSPEDMSPEEQQQAKKNAEEFVKAATEIEELDNQLATAAPEIAEDAASQEDKDKLLTLVETIKKESAERSARAMSLISAYGDRLDKELPQEDDSASVAQKGSGVQGRGDTNEGESGAVGKGLRGGERDSTKERGPSLPKFKSQKISIPKILGPTKTIEIGDLPVNEQFEIRNLIVPLIQEGNPATMAFIDPANAGTGYFASTVDPVSDLKKDLRFMAQQGLTNPAKIRAKLKQKFNSRDDRRVLRKSRRFYKKNRGEDFSSQYISDETGIPESANNSSQFSENNSGMMEAAANDGFTSNASRKKNLLNIFKQSKISINNQTKIMNKQAQQQDSFIDLYFKDAVKGVEDAYAKAYFAGLNSMQDFDSKKEPDYSNLYDVHKETGEDLILSAHPTVSKPVEAKGDGGVVENALEQHRKMLDIAFNVPSGNFRSKQAFVIGELVKIANLADENGNLEAASLIDEFLQEFVESK